MSTTLAEPTAQSAASPARRLRAEMAATRVSLSWLGVRKSLTAQQKAEAASAFDAEGDCVTAGKKLLDTRHEAYRAVTAVKTHTLAYWRSETLPYPEPGLRLIRRDQIDRFDEQMRGFRRQLAEAVENLDRHYAELREAARRRLGRLYNPADYPESLQGLFAIEWTFPSVEPPDYLRRLQPALYEAESRRVQARFDEAVELAERAFLEELNKLVSHLSERLSGGEDGKPKVFRDTAIENLSEFFQRFQRLNVRSSEELDQVVEQAQQIVSGVAPQSLRDNGLLRQSVSQELAEVQSSLDDLLVDRPRRNILRRPK